MVCVARQGILKELVILNDFILVFLPTSKAINNNHGNGKGAHIVAYIALIVSDRIYPILNTRCIIITLHYLVEVLRPVL